MCTEPAPAASRGSIPFARSAPITPARTSPVPAVASDEPVREDEDAFAGRGDQRVRPLQQHRRAEARRPTDRLQTMRVDLRRLGAEKRCELARVRRHHRRRRTLERLELPQAVGVEDDRHRQLLEQDADKSRVPSLRPSPGPSTTAWARSAASSTSPAARGSRRPRLSSGSPPLHRLEEARLEHGQGGLRGGDGDVPGVGAKAASAASIGAPLSPREPPTTSTEPARYS